MNHKNLKLSLMVGVFATAASFACSNSPVQTVIDGHNGLRISLPTDGSTCDPSVISANLETLKKLNILDVSNLTETVAAHGHCYGPCQEQLEAALEVHCAKAESLAKIVEAVTK